MTRSRFSVVVLIQVVAAAFAMAPQVMADGPTFVPIFYPTSGSIWVNADEVAGDGGVDLAPLGRFLSTFEAQRAMSRTETLTPQEGATGQHAVCTNLAWFSFNPRRGALDFDTSLPKFGWILQGTVTNTYPGFFRGKFGSLIEVQVSDVIYEAQPLEIPATVFVFTTNVSYRLGEESICSTDPTFPYLPSPESPVLLLLRDFPPDTGNSLFRMADVFLELRPGDVVTSSRYAKSSRLLSLGSLEAVRAYLIDTMGDKAMKHFERVKRELRTMSGGHDPESTSGW